MENDYEPKYITIRGKGEILATLRKEAKKSDKVYLATDPDREGNSLSFTVRVGRNQTKFIFQPTLTVKERLFPGILLLP